MIWLGLTLVTMLGIEGSTALPYLLTFQRFPSHGSQTKISWTYAQHNVRRRRDPCPSMSCRFEQDDVPFPQSVVYSTGSTI